MDKYFPDGDKTSSFTMYGHAVAQTLEKVLRQAGDDLTRENIMRQAADLKEVEVGLLLPGIKINTSPSDYDPIEQMQMQRFNGERWEPIGEVMSGELRG
jgi:branched-chain amino acid transport system substrate-binding protein